MAVRRQIRAFTIANDVSDCVDALHATILNPTAQGRGGLLAALNLQPPATSLPAESVDSFGLTAEARRQLQDLTNTQLVGRDLLDAAFLSPATRRRAREIFNAAQRDLRRQKRQQARSSSRRPRAMTEPTPNLVNAFFIFLPFHGMNTGDLSPAW